MPEISSLLQVACILIGLSILACLIILLRRLKQPRESASRDVLVNPVEVMTPDIEIAVVERSSLLSEDVLPSELGYTLEPILRSIPALANVVGGSGGVFRVTFSSEVMKGIADKSLSLMPRANGFQATVINSSGQIVENGVVTLDRTFSSVAAASAIWQILSVITAQKFLHDINKRLASIEEGIKRLETWLDSQEQGKFLGNMKYMADISRQKSIEYSPDQFVAIKNQLEHIYHSSLQCIAANSIRAEIAVTELISKKFTGNLESKEAEFRRLMEAYFIPTSYAIRFMLSAASSECLAAFVEKRSGRDMGRLDTIVRDAEEMLQTIKIDAEKMREKSLEIKSGFWDWNTEEKEMAKGKSLRSDIETLAGFCEQLILRIRSMNDESKRIGSFAKEIESTGLSVIAELDSSGKVVRLYSGGLKKGSGS